MSFVDEFYRESHATGHVYYGKRGKTAVKAVDHDTEQGKLYPIVAELEHARSKDWNFQEVSREEVPDEVEEHLEDRFQRRKNQLETLVDAVSDDTSEGGTE